MDRSALSAPEKLTETAAKDYPGAGIRVSFPDQWQLVHRFQRSNTPLYVAGFPPSHEHPRSDHFLGLSRKINQSVDTYRLYKLFEPYATPVFQVEWNSYIGRGRIIGGQDVQVQLQPIGQAQMWKGKTDGVLWECFLHETRRGGINWKEELTTFWQAVERDMGVKRIFTEPHEPTFTEGYTNFLGRLGYRPNSNDDRWWSKWC